MEFVPLNEVKQEIPQGLSFVPLEETNKPSLSFVPLEGAAPKAEPTGSVTIEGARMLSPEEEVTSQAGAPTTTTEGSSPLFGSLQKGIVGAKQAYQQYMLSELTNLQEADKAKYGANYENAPPDKLLRIQERDAAIKNRLEQVAQYGVERKDIEEKYGVNPLLGAVRKIGGSETYKGADTLDQLKMYGDAIWENKSDIPGYIASIGIESLPSSIPSIAAAIAAKQGGLGVKGAAIAGGGGSALTEFGNQYAELRAEGMGHKEAWEKAGVKSGVIGMFDAASFNSAGKMASTVMKDVEKGALAAVAKQTGKELSKQALYGMAGEAGGSFAIGQKLDPIQIIEEGLGEMVGAPLEAVSTYQERKAATPTTPTTETTPSTKVTPPTETAPTTEVINKQFLNTVTKYQQQGFTAADAEKLANEDFKELGYGDQLIARASEPGISVSGEPSETISGTIGTGPTSLAGPSATAGVASSGEAAQFDTLVENLKTKYNLNQEQAVQAATESLRQKQISADFEAQKTAAATTPTEVTPTEVTEKPFNWKNIDSPESKQIQSSTSTMAHTLFNPNNVRTDGRPGWDEPPKERWVLINAFDTGGMDARSDFFRPQDYKNKKEKQAYELGHKYANSLMAGSPIDVTNEAANLIPTTPAKPKGRPKAVKTPEEIAAAQETRKQQAALGRDAMNSINRANNVLSKPFNAEADFATEREAQDALDEFNNKRRAVLEAVYAISIDPSQKNKTAGLRAKEMLSKVTPQEAENAKLRHETRQKTKAAAVPKLAREDIGSFGRVTTTEDVQPLIGEATNRNNNPKYGTFTNATQAINWVAKNGNVFEKFLAKRIAPFLQGVKLVIVDDISQIPKRFQKDFDGAAGLYYESKSNRTIYLDRESGINNTIFLHEALHGATMARINRFIKDFSNDVAIPKKLEEAMIEMHRTMFAAKDRLEVLKKLGIADKRMLHLEKVGAFDDIKEFVAYGMSHPDMQEFLMQTKGVYAGETTESSLFSKFIQGIRKFFDMGAEHKSAMQDLVIITDKLLTAPSEEVIQEDTAAAKKVSKKVVAIDKNLEKLKQSNNAKDAVDDIGKLIQEHGAEGYIDLLQARFDDMGNGFISKLLYAIQTVDIIRWVGDKIPALKKIDALQNEMAAMRARLLASSAKKADELAAFIRKNGSVVLSDTMHLARLERISPTQYPDVATALVNDSVIKHYNTLLLDPNKSVEQKASYKGKITSRSKAITKMYAQWDKLGKQKGGHEMYTMVREFYKDNYTATRTLLDEQINAMNIDAAAKAKLLKSVRLMQEKTLSDVDKDLDGMKQNAILEDYFPLKRDGKYWLRVAKGPTGREFYLFPNGAARNLFLARRAKELNLDKNDGAVFSKGDDINSLRKDFQDSSLMLQEIFANIETITTDPKFDTSKYASAEEANKALKEELKDQIYQTYLMTMPERSFRKQFLHAEKVTGFSADVLQNFKTSATSYANQLSKLKYGIPMSNELQNARDSLTPEYRVPEKALPTDERAKLELFINEMAKRTDEELNPPEEGQVVTRINQFAFLMLLTSGASAATQMASVPIMVMPTLNAEYGYGASAKAFAKYSQLWKSMGITKKEANGDITFTAPSMGSSKMVKSNPVLQRAFEEAVEKYNLFQLTNTSVITNRARTPDSSYESKIGAGLRMSFNAMTAMFSGSERMSREITYMMTFELEYAKTKNFDASVQKAIDTTHEVLGRYDNFNRPRILRNAIGRTVGQFKQYSVFMTSFFLRNAHTIFKEGLLEAEGREAMHRLSGVLVMGGLFHGLVGMPLYSLICSTIDAVLDNLGDEEEKRKRRASNPLTADDSNLRFRYEFLPKYFGQIEVPGLDGRQHRLSELLEKGPISALTDINIGSRTSFDGMWFREAKPGKNYLETVQNYILANMGPGVSTGINMVGGIDDMLGGHIDRGLEKMVPALFKGSLVAERMRKEGAETKGGADILKKSELNELNYIASVLGFTPTRLARLQEKNFQFQKQITAANNERTALLRRLDETIMDTENKQKGADVRDIFKNIAKFNKRYPAEAFVIEPDDIERSIDAYAKKRGMTIRGQYIDEKLAPYLMKPTKAAAPLP